MSWLRSLCCSQRWRSCKHCQHRQDRLRWPCPQTILSACNRFNTTGSRTSSESALSAAVSSTTSAWSVSLNSCASAGSAGIFRAHRASCTCCTSIGRKDLAVRSRARSSATVQESSVRKSARHKGRENVREAMTFQGRKKLEKSAKHQIHLHPLKLANKRLLKTVPKETVRAFVSDRSNHAANECLKHVTVPQNHRSEYRTTQSNCR